MRITGKIALICGALGLAAIALTGCAGAAAVASEEQATPAAYATSSSQTDALADGKVDRAEYDASFANYQACMDKSGYPVIVLDAKSTIIDVRIPAAAVDSGADAKCYQTEFSAVDAAWQVAHQDQRADNALLDACLAHNGLAVPATRQEKVDALLNAKVDLGSCLAGQ